MLQRLIDIYGVWFRRRLLRDSDRIMSALVVMDEYSQPQWHYGLDIMHLTTMSAGRFFTASTYLEEQGKIEGEFEPGDYPRRKMYRIAHDRN